MSKLYFKLRNTNTGSIYYLWDTFALCLCQLEVCPSDCIALHIDFFSVDTYDRWTTLKFLNWKVIFPQE